MAPPFIRVMTNKKKNMNKINNSNTVYKITIKVNKSILSKYLY